MGLTKLGGNTLVLSGSNTYTSPTVVTAGTLQMGSGGTSGSVAGNIADNGVVTFNRSDPSVTFGGVISGTGSVTQMGMGTLVFVGSNTYTGGTSIGSGTLQLGDGVANNGTIQGNVTNGGALVFANPFAQTYSGQISGNGILMNGPGLLVLGGSNTCTGNTTVSAGTLQIGNGGGWEALPAASPTMAFSRSVARIA